MVSIPKQISHGINNIITSKLGSLDIVSQSDSQTDRSMRQVRSTSSQLNLGHGKGEVFIPSDLSGAR